MSGRLITVLYEDEQAKGEKNYGPHVLLLACVADRHGTDRYTLMRRIVGTPRKGDSKLKKTLVDDGADLAAVGPLIAMFDNDKVRACYGLAPGACKRELLETIRGQAQGSPTIVLLEQNMEDLVDACCDAMSQPRPVTKPKPIERDRILQKAAAGSRTERDAVLTALPSWKRLVDVVFDHVTVIGVMES